uniref:6-phosphofructo-2-kinase/fructose-2, 6-biphosphatase 1 n=1 Tax=Caligus rogercresseyi TaxID=217165 RepID=C1BMC9_CALRO|nr:6-phosphofructo-2-kinase/fructose-2,6-biphosphatase 1 [Caligus rogercresseyi]
MMPSNGLRTRVGEVAVIDATNTTTERRKFLFEKIVIEKGFKLFFVESICDDEKIINANIRTVKISSPDYVNFSEDEVVEDFRKRIKHYECIYETIDEDMEPHLSFMKIFNAGQKVLVHKHEGHIQSRAVYYLMNIKITPRTIYLTRHGESNHNVMRKIGGDAMLTDNGLNYASELGKYINGLKIENLSVWTSWMRRTIQTAKHISGIHERWKTLNELDVGICDGMTYEEIMEHYPQDFRARDEDKYRYRYPRGESYEDLVARLEPVIMELERHGSVIVIGHQAVLRCILAYFTEKDEDELPYIKIPMHSILTLSPRAYGCEVKAIPIDVPCVDTHRPKPCISGTL